MCGRFTNLLSWAEMVALFAIDRPGPAANWPARHNIAPTQPVPIVRSTMDGGRELVLARWGLIPPWAKDASIASRLINARSESLAEKPSFRNAFRRRRCLIPADGFYEWPETGPGKQPFRIVLAKHRPFAFAGLWERWEKASDGIPVETCTIVTTAANPFLAAVHDRMPVILEGAAADAWLDRKAGIDTLCAIMRPYGGAMERYAVSSRVNSVRHDDPTCIAPLVVDGAVAAP